MAKNKYTTEQFIEDLMKYFEAFPEKVDDYLEAKVNTKDTMGMYVNSVVKERLNKLKKEKVK